jgi:hypothetical protein
VQRQQSFKRNEDDKKKKQATHIEEMQKIAEYCDEHKSFAACRLAARRAAYSERYILLLGHWRLYTFLACYGFQGLHFTLSR